MCRMPHFSSVYFLPSSRSVPVMYEILFIRPSLLLHLTAVYYTSEFVRAVLISYILHSSCKVVSLFLW